MVKLEKRIKHQKKKTTVAKLLEKEKKKSTAKPKTKQIEKPDSLCMPTETWNKLPLETKLRLISKISEPEQKKRRLLDRLRGKTD